MSIHLLESKNILPSDPSKMTEEQQGKIVQLLHLLHPFVMSGLQDPWITLTLSVHIGSLRCSLPFVQVKYWLVLAAQSLVIFSTFLVTSYVLITVFLKISKKYAPFSN
jgi:hypothetical protein